MLETWHWDNCIEQVIIGNDVLFQSGFTPLHIASHYGNINVGTLLIDKGADVNFKARNSILPLHVASKWGRTNMVTLLLDNGGLIDGKTRDGLSPLHCGARSGHEQVKTGKSNLLN